MSLFEAVAAGDVARVEALLDGGEHPDPFDAEGCTPLMRAAEAGREDVVRLLMDRGADPALKDGVGELALHKAATHGHAELCALLMPYAREDEQEMARTLLRVSAYPNGLPPRTEAPTPVSGWRQKLAAASAFVSEKVGDDAPAQRLERARRAEKERGKP